MKVSKWKTNKNKPGWWTTLPLLFALPTTKTWLKATCVAIIFISTSFSKSMLSWKWKILECPSILKHRHPKHCVQCAIILTINSCDWGYIFQDFGYTIDAKPVKNVNENVTPFLSWGWTKGPRKWNKLFTWHIDRRGPLGLLTDNVRKCHQHIVSYYYYKIIKYVTV